MSAVGVMATSPAQARAAGCDVEHGARYNASGSPGITLRYVNLYNECSYHRKVCVDIAGYPDPSSNMFPGGLGNLFDDEATSDHPPRRRRAGRAER